MSSKIHNWIKCRKCGIIIESQSRHDFVWCPCHSIFVDGGEDYCRRGGNLEDIIELDQNGKEIEILQQQTEICNLPWTKEEIETRRLKILGGDLLWN